MNNFKKILEEKGIMEAVSELDKLPEKDTAYFSALVAKSVLHLFEAEHPNDMRIRDHIENKIKWSKGEITDEEYRASYAAGGVAAAAFTVAAAFAAAAFTAAFAGASADASVVAKWEEIEQIYIDVFCKEDTTKEVSDIAKDHEIALKLERRHGGQCELYIDTMEKCFLEMVELYERSQK